jgi:hypothetical protein
MTTTAGLVFTAIILGFIVAVILYRRQRIESFRRAVLALGGAPTRPGPLPEAVNWAGTEIVAARAFQIVPGVPATFIALMRSASPAASEDLGSTKADPFLLLRLPGEAIADEDEFRRVVATAVPLDAVSYDDTGHAIVMVRAFHTGPRVETFVAAVRAGLEPAPRPASMADVPASLSGR